MMVKALCLRRHGVRLTAEQLRLETPIAGKLTLCADVNRPRTMRCLLMSADGSTDDCIQLLRARVRRIDSRGLLIAGIEQHWRRKHSEDYPQTLWAWPVSPDELLPAPPDSIDAEEHAEQVAAASHNRDSLGAKD